MSLASALTHIGEFASAFDRLVEVIELAEAEKLEALALAARGSQLIASISSGKGDPPVLARRLTRCARELGQPGFGAFAEGMVGALDLIQGRFAEACAHLARSRELDPNRFSLAFGYHIVSALLAGELEQADSAAHRAMLLTLPTTPLAQAAAAWNPQRAIALWHAWRGDIENARRVEASALAKQLARPMPLADADHLVTLAALAFFASDAERCAVLLGVARNAMGVHRSWRGHDAGPLYLHFRARCDEALGRDRAEELRKQGLALAPDAVLADARAELASG